MTGESRVPSKIRSSLQLIYEWLVSLSSFCCQLKMRLNFDKGENFSFFHQRKYSIWLSKKMFIFLIKCRKGFSRSSKPPFRSLLKNCIYLDHKPCFVQQISLLHCIYASGQASEWAREKWIYFSEYFPSVSTNIFVFRFTFSHTPIWPTFFTLYVFSSLLIFTLQMSHRKEKHFIIFIHSSIFWECLNEFRFVAKRNFFVRWILLLLN